MTRELNDPKSQRKAQNLGCQANYGQNPYHWGPPNNQNQHQRNRNFSGNWNQDNSSGHNSGRNRSNCTNRNFGQNCANISGVPRSQAGASYNASLDLARGFEAYGNRIYYHCKLPGHVERVFERTDTAKDQFFTPVSIYHKKNESFQSAIFF